MDYYQYYPYSTHFKNRKTYSKNFELGALKVLKNDRSSNTWLQGYIGTSNIGMFGFKI